MDADRRRMPRVPVSFLLEDLSSDDQMPEECQGIVKNITSNGMLLETNIKVRKNNILQLAFTLPNTKKTLNLEGRICWIEMKNVWSIVGLEFMDLSLEQHEAIRDYLLTLGVSI